MIPLASYDNFETASTEVLNYLHSRLGFKLWMVTRVESDNWIVLNAHDDGYNVTAGDVFRWTDSFCSHMVKGQGPRIAPRSDDVPAYASAPIGQQVPIGAYVGVPMTRASGELFGTLCAIDPSPMPEEIANELPLIEMMARLLTTILENELKAQDEHRRAERANAEAMIDQLTGLYNRRGWDKLLEQENQRCKRYGHPACVVSIDLDNLKTVNDEQGHASGDALLRRAAEAINSAARESDVVARIGGDEFTILAIQCDAKNAKALTERMSVELDLANVSASFGFSMWHASGSLADALERADLKMYECKKRRKGRVGKSTDHQTTPISSGT